MSAELATRPTTNGALAHHELDTLTLGNVLAKSGYFKDAQDAAKCIVKVLYGREVGIGPATSMSAIHIVEGKPTYSSTLMATLVKRSGKYNYRVLTLTNDKCELAFFEREGGKMEEIGRSSFSMDEARAAGLAGRPVWKSYARNMLFARALSNGARWYCPDVFGGTPAYTPEELGAEVDGETGEILRPASSGGELQVSATAAPEPDGEPDPLPEPDPDYVPAEFVQDTARLRDDGPPPELYAEEHAPRASTGMRPGDVPATPKQLETIRKMARAAGAAIATDGLTRARASQIISELLGGMDQRAS